MSLIPTVLRKEEKVNSDSSEKRREKTRKDPFLPKNRPVSKLRKDCSELFSAFLNIARKNSSELFFSFSQILDSGRLEAAVLNFNLRLSSRSEVVTVLSFSLLFSTFC